MQEAQAAPLAADLQPQKILIFVRTATSSSSVPVYIAPSAHLKDLAELLRHIFHVDPTRHTFALEDTPLHHNTTLHSQGVHERTVVTLRQTHDSMEEQ